MKLYSHIALLALALVLYACNTPNALTKKGDKLQTAGLSKEAADNYYNALKKKRGHVNAQIGMKQAGQLVLNDKLQTFSKHKSFGSKKDAVYSYIEAEDYFKRVFAVGVSLQLPEFYKGDFEQVKESYLNDLYAQGSELLEKDQFNQAQNVFAEISKLDPNFKDAGELKQVATIEPMYRAGSQAFEIHEYRKAYENFIEVKKRNSNYKDTNDRLADCLVKGQYGIAILPFENASGIQGADSKMSAYTMSYLLKLNDPFLKVIDRENFDQIIQEQHLSLSGVIDQSTAATVGNLLGAKALLTGTVLSQKTNEQKITYQNKKGFESYQVKKLNAETNTHYFETQYKEVSYKEYQGKNNVVLTVQFKMTSLQTGEVIMSKVIEKSAFDEVFFATYEGNVNNLYPSNGNTVLTGKNEFQSLQNKLNAKKTLVDISSLTNTTYEQTSAAVSAELGAALKNLVK